MIILHDFYFFILKNLQYTLSVISIYVVELAKVIKGIIYYIRLVILCEGGDPHLLHHFKMTRCINTFLCIVSQNRNKIIRMIKKKQMYLLKMK